MGSHENSSGIRQFRGCEYADWKFRIECLFEEKDLLNYLNFAPTELELANAPYVAGHKTAKNLLVRHVAPSHISLIKSKTTVYEMWQTLSNIYAPKTLGKRVAIKRKLNEARMHQSESLEEFIQRFDALVDDYRISGGVMDEDEAVQTLLSALPEEYDNVATVVQSMTECQYDKVKSLLLEREQRLKGNKDSAEHEQSIAFQARKGEKPRNKKKEKKKKPNTCWTCGAKDHKSPNCPKNTHKNGPNDGESHFSNSFAFMAGGSEHNGRKVSFYVDSGASEHLVSDESLLSEVVKLENPIQIQVAKDDASIVARVGGKMHLSHKVTNEREESHNKLSLSNVLVAEGLRYNLLSVRQIESKGGSLTFDKGRVVIKFGDKVAAIGYRTQKLYVVDFNIIEDDASDANLACQCNHSKDELWHRRLGHLGMKNVSKLVNSGMTTGVKNKLSDKIPSCETCILGKQTRQPYSGERPKTCRPLERVHTDVCGPMPVTATDGSRYFISFMDDFTHFTVTYLMKQKSETFEKFKQFHGMATSHFNLKLARLRSDRGTEYTCHEMKDFCKSQGIIMEINPPHNPQLNGVAERLNRTLMEKARTMLIDGALPNNLWSEAVMTATYLLNRSPTVKLDDMTPYEAWFGSKPDISKLRVFGSKAYAHADGQLKKLDCRSSKPLIMIGYDFSGYRLWDSSARKMVVRRNVTFIEEEPSIVINPSPEVNSGEKLRTKLIKKNPISTPATPKTPVTPATIKNKAKSTHEEAEESSEDEFKGFTDNEDDPVTPRNIRKPVSTVIRRNPPRICRKDLKPRSLEDYEMHLALSAVNWIAEDPLNYADVIGRHDEKEWLAAIDSELTSLEENETWEIVDKPADVKLLGTRWVFKVKDEPSGIKYKARLVVRGYQQKEGVDYHETYAPVARLPTIRMLLALSVRHELAVRHLDVTTAFLYGNLDEDVHLKAPDGVNVPEGKVIKLRRSLYGLKQSPKCWNTRFHDFVANLGFERSRNDYCLYVKQDDESITYMVLYVDDVLLATNNNSRMNEIIKQLSSEFKMKDLGTVKRFMGININLEPGRITLDQEHYAIKIIEKFGMDECKPVRTPIETNLQLSRADGKPTSQPFRELIGSLMYLALGTRPDLSYAISYLSRFQEGATDEHYAYLKRILRYLRGTSNLKLCYKFDDKAQPIEAFVDSDYASSEDRKSTTGYIIFVYKCPIMWASKKQPTVSLSSTEAEFVAANYAVCEVIWLRKIFSDLSLQVSEPTVVYEDNQGAISMSKNAETRRTKHMDVKYHFIRDCVQNKAISLKYIPTTEQLADILTKGLPRDQFEKLRTCIMSGSDKGWT